jgi:hypothetical protein
MRRPTLMASTQPSPAVTVSANSLPASRPVRARPLWRAGLVANVLTPAAIAARTTRRPHEGARRRRGNGDSRRRHSGRDVRGRRGGYGARNRGAAAPAQPLTVGRSTAAQGRTVGGDRVP